jgi:hypothetical protein
VRLYRGGDLDSLGGVLMLASGRLLSVSNLAVTAYSLGDAAKDNTEPEKTAQTTAGSGGR